MVIYLSARRDFLVLGSGFQFSVFFVNNRVGMAAAVLAGS